VGENTYFLLILSYVYGETKLTNDLKRKHWQWHWCYIAQAQSSNS